MAKGENADIILAAIQSLGPIPENEGLGEHMLPIVRRATEIARIVDEGSMASQALASVVIRAKIVSVEIEQSSNRGIIEFVATNSEAGEVETIRTPRLESKYGQGVFDAAKSKVGKFAYIYKHNEESAKTPGRSYRIAVFVQ